MPKYKLWIKGAEDTNDYVKEVKAESKEKAVEKLLNEDLKLTMAGWSKDVLKEHIRKVANEN